MTEKDFLRAIHENTAALKENTAAQAKLEKAFSALLTAEPKQVTQNTGDPRVDLARTGLECLRDVLTQKKGRK